MHILKLIHVYYPKLCLISPMTDFHNGSYNNEGMVRGSILEA